MTFLNVAGDGILSGDIAVSPLDGRETPACKYCDYAAVCGYEDGDRQRQLADYGRFDNAKKVLQETLKGETAE